MQRLPALIPIVALVLAGVLLAGCGASSLRDPETATDAQAAQAADTGDAATTTADAATAAGTAGATATVEAAPVEPSTDDPGAWSVIQTGAQTFAAQLDQANQSVASCQTDAAAGQDFDSCVGNAYTAISTAAAELAATVDQTIGQAGGDCRAALTTLREAAQAMVDDYARAVVTTDLTSREALDVRLSDDTRAYADGTLAAANACMG